MGSGRFRGAVTVTLVLALLALLSSAALADVGQPIDLGAGQNPNVTLEADGTAHVAFTGQGANSAELDYCRLPRGATGCSVRTVIAAPGDSLTRPFAFGSGNNISVISYRYGLTNGPFAQVLLFQSGDGGASFGPGVPIGTIPPYDFAFGPGGLISAVTNAVTAELDYQGWSLTGNTTAKAVLDGDPYEYLGTVAMIDPTTPIVVYASRGGDGRFRRYTGIGDVNDQASWTAAADIGTIDSPHLVAGPSGVILLGQDALSGSKLEARRYDGTTFGPRTLITEGTHADHAVQDGDGRTHVVSSRYGGKTGSQFFYATSYDGSAWLSEGVDYPSLPQNLRVAVNPDHFGTTVGTLYGNGHVFAASVGPAAAEPTPGKFVGASVVSGTVLIQIPPSNKFVPLRPGDVVPVGSVIDATKGRVRITIKLPNGKLQSSDFYQGVFRVTQAKSGLATMVLTGGNFRACGRAAAVVRAAKSKKLVRRLWGSGSGKFATKGRFASATIRGTIWDMQDRCDGTLTVVKQGSVVVRDLKKKRSVVVKNGRSYLAKG
jgi:hypothetical protein